GIGIIETSLKWGVPDAKAENQHILELTWQSPRVLIVRLDFGVVLSVTCQIMNPAMNFIWASAKASCPPRPDLAFWPVAVHLPFSSVAITFSRSSLFQVSVIRFSETPAIRASNQ